MTIKLQQANTSVDSFHWCKIGSVISHSLIPQEIEAFKLHCRLVYSLLLLRKIIKTQNTLKNRHVFSAIQFILVFVPVEYFPRRCIPTPETPWSDRLPTVSLGSAFRAAFLGNLSLRNTKCYTYPTKSIGDHDGLYRHFNNHRGSF